MLVPQNIVMDLNNLYVVEHAHDNDNLWYPKNFKTLHQVILAPNQISWVTRVPKRSCRHQTYQTQVWMCYIMYHLSHASIIINFLVLSFWIYLVTCRSGV